MDRTGRIWIVVLWITTLGWTSVLGLREITSCLETASTSEVRLSCDDKYMILVTRAFLGRTRNKNIEKFCSTPHSSSDDCRSNEATMTADVGLKTSTFTRGSYSVPRSESAQCGVGYTGYSYIHVEYECLARNNPKISQTIPYDYMLSTDKVVGTLVYMLSPAYGNWNHANVSSCRVNVPQGATLEVTIYDFLSNTSNTECSARLLVTTDSAPTKVCAQTKWAKKTLKYEATPSGQNVDFFMQQTTSTIASRLLILLNATGELLVECGPDVVTLPPTMPSVSTTTIPVTQGNTATTPQQSSKDNTASTILSGEEATTPTRRTSSLAATTLKPRAEETSTADNIVNFLKDNVITLAASGATLLVIVVIVVVVAVVVRTRGKRPSTASVGNNTRYNDATTHVELITLQPDGTPHTYENLTSSPEASGNDTAAYETIVPQVEASGNDTATYENVDTPTNTVTDNEYEHIGRRNEYETLRTYL